LAEFEVEEAGIEKGEVESWMAQFVEPETQFELVERRGNGLGLAFAVSYGWATQRERPTRSSSAPSACWRRGKFLLTTNTFFSDQRGEFAETEGLGLMVIAEDRALPRFIFHKDAWVCVDHPRQLKREDCLPRRK
jgi:hypothetical protein